jgi:hypothetical protein
MLWRARFLYQLDILSSTGVSTPKDPSTRTGQLYKYTRCFVMIKLYLDYDTQFSCAVRERKKKHYLDFYVTNHEVMKVFCFGKHLIWIGMRSSSQYHMDFGGSSCDCKG